MSTKLLLKPLQAVLLLAVALLPQAAAAYDFMVGGLCYNRNSDGTSVTVTYQNSSSPRYSNLSGNLVIPATVTYRGTTYSVTSISEYAFYSCSGLNEVTIPNSVTSIGERAFSGCSGLTSVTIPNSVTSIGGYAFDGTAWYNNQPYGLVYAGLIAYRYKGMMSSGTSIKIQEGAKGISPYCFSGCSGLTSVTIPNSVTSIGEYAFKDCSGLTSVTIGNSVTSIGTGAFRACRGLTSVSIPNSVSRLGALAFYNCSGLKTVSIGTGLVTMDLSTDDVPLPVFSGCNALTSVTWNAKNCADFTSSTTPFSAANSSIKSFTIGGQVQRIPAYLCSGLTGLTSVTIPNSVTSIGSSAFDGCSGLKELTWNAINCSSMGDMPKGNIEQVTIGDGVEVLPCSFAKGSKITSVTIPNSVTSIGNYAFEGCSGLTSVTIPNSVTSIGYGAFSDCSGLTLVSIGKSVTSIGDYAFQGCSGLWLVCSKIVEPEGIQLGDNVFAGIPFATCILNVPSGSIASYQSADQWKDFLMIVDIGYDVNLDGTIDIADVNAVVNKMLERDGAPTKERADVNRDDDVDIFDVNEVISAMLGIGNLPELSRAKTYTVNGVSFTMISVKGGTFTMGATAEQEGDAYDAEKPAHRVTLSNYTIGQTEVTQALWQAVMGSNPSGYTGDLQRPVECVSWDDCQTFITKLNQLTGKNFRLPTEAEWEYAARGGNQSQGYKYAGSDNVDEVAWYSGNSNSTTHRVATKAPNELGLYDMSGNVWEWCQDRDGSYSSDAQTNPTGPTGGWAWRMFRGGGWASDARNCRVSSRNNYPPSYAYKGLGLRLAL